MPTDCLFRDDSCLKECTALVVGLTEAGGIVLDGEPTLFGIYYNQRRMRDHVVVYVSRRFGRPNPPRYPNREIAEAGFFDPASLPDESTPATRRRLAEILAGEAADPFW